MTVADGVITVDLANGGAPTAVVGEENKRLAVQELVWTAQAAIQQTLPVRFEIADGSTKLFGSISTDQDFTRPPSDRLYEDIAPIWVTSPSRDQVLPAAKPVVVKGLAIVFEATVNWQLERGTTRWRRATPWHPSGRRCRASTRFSLGTLAAGDYTIRVRELSAKDGSVSAEKTVSFSVKWVAVSASDWPRSARRARPVRRWRNAARSHPAGPSPPRPPRTPRPPRA